MEFEHLGHEQSGSFGLYGEQAPSAAVACRVAFKELLQPLPISPDWAPKERDAWELQCDAGRLSSQVVQEAPEGLEAFHPIHAWEAAAALDEVRRPAS